MGSQSGTKKKNRLQLLHQYYVYTGFYTFLKDALKKALPPILLVVAAIVLIHFFVIDLNTALQYVIDNYSNLLVLTLFFVSESILGIIPPELFIAWSDKTSNPILYLSLIAILSYAGGAVSYFTGRAALKIPSVHNYLEVKMEKHLKNARKWGGFLILVGALLPLPFAVASLAAGMIRFEFKYWALFGLARFVRYAIYGAAIFSLVS
ncbi:MULTISPECIES: short-chain dehydrogenase [unclassified Dokdonia]|jgi:membrane protein YqaA with SNARE-associated domain|uniref:YqaA family protein n=1 Tax=unclassified Dokdonia TaxID=2615033 RepID=UPI0030ECCD0B|tara:strand:+ start:97841 stop:98461 length:621 start_codon:yes stop_codon:yes gene_type:complete